MEQKRLLLRRDGLGDSTRLGLPPSDDGEWLVLWAFVSPDYWEIFEITHEDNVLWAWQAAQGANRLRPGKAWGDIIAYVALPRPISEAAGAGGIALPDDARMDGGPEDILSALHRLGWTSARWHPDPKYVWVAPYYLSREHAAKLIVECLTDRKTAANFPVERVREYADFGPFKQPIEAPT